ncbi:MAG: PilZ domain-containing protein [Candidatus Xenobia bacterium]
MNWNQLLERLKGLGANVDPQLSASERRRSWRVDRRVGLVGFRGNGQKLTLSAVNIGPGGVRVESGAPLRKGEELKLRPPYEQGRHADLAGSEDGVWCRVVWCRKRKSGAGFEGGLMFLADRPGRLTPQQLLESCGVLIHDPREQRKSPRIPVHLKGLMQKTDGDVLEVSVSDLAVGGAQFISPQRLHVETRLPVKILLPDGNTFESHAVIVRVRPGPTEDTVALGVTFIHTPPDQRERLTHYLSQQLSDR